MKPFKILALIFIITCTLTQVMAQDLIVKESSKNPERTVEALKSQIKSMDLNLVQHINHSEAANKANMELAPTHVLIFGNPEVGTQLMKTDPRVAIELPLRILVYQEGGRTKVAYRDLSYLSQTFQLGGQGQTISKMKEALDKITDEAIK